MKEYIALLRRELRSVTQEKTIILAIIVQLFIASFSSVILEGVMAFYDPSSIGWASGAAIKAGFIGGADSRMLTYLRSKGIVAKPFSEVASAEAAFRGGQIDMILIEPETQSNPVNMKLVLPNGEAKKMMILVLLDEPLKKYEDYLRQANGVQVSFKDFGGKPYSGYEFLYAVLIPMLILFPALVAGSIVIDTVSEEFENKTLDTLMAAPVSIGQVLISKISAAMVTGIIQILLTMVLLRWNGIVIEQLFLVLVLALGLTITISLGAAAIALFLKDRQRAQFIYSLTIVTVGAASYLVNSSPLELIARLSSGLPDLSVIAVALYAVLPITAGLIAFYLAERFFLSER